MSYVISLPCIVKGKKVETVLDPERDFRYLIEEYMGYDAAHVFDEILKSVRDEVEEVKGGDDYEAISDGQRTLLVDTMNDLHEVLSQSRISRKRIEEIYSTLNRNL